MDIGRIKTSFKIKLCVVLSDRTFERGNVSVFIYNFSTPFK